MKLIDKIRHLERVLCRPQLNYADSFKTDIIIYFDENFSEENDQLYFLNNFSSMQEIESFVDLLESQFVMKFDSKSESENDFIYDFLFHLNRK